MPWFAAAAPAAASAGGAASGAGAAAGAAAGAGTAAAAGATAGSMAGAATGTAAGTAATASMMGTGASASTAGAVGQGIMASNIAVGASKGLAGGLSATAPAATAKGSVLKEIGMAAAQEGIRQKMQPKPDMPEPEYPGAGSKAGPYESPRSTGIPAIGTPPEPLRPFSDYIAEALRKV